MRTEILLARSDDVISIKGVLSKTREAFGFTPRSVLDEAIRRQEVVVAVCGGQTIGFAQFHHRKDRVTTLHKIAVLPPFQGRGIGKHLLHHVIEEAKRSGQEKVRLKCPLDLPANGFYSAMGFCRVRIEDGKRRSLAVWELRIADDGFLSYQNPVFFVTLTHEPGEIRSIIRLWDESGDARDPFAQVIFTPLFSTPGTLARIRQLKDERGSIVMFDSGGYQVQMGRAGYEELFDRLLGFYRENTWADWYVLPDHVPRSTDTAREVEFKVRETIDFARLFLRMMPVGFSEKAVGVVHGRTEEQVRQCTEAYVDMGVCYVGFGSFGTSGPNGTVNKISQRSLNLLRLVQTLGDQHGLHLHVFGIGSPRHLIRLADAGIRPTSFDSAGWWKAGGFGNIFFPGGRQLHITAISTPWETSTGVEHEKRRSGHCCPFCADIRVLRRSRMRRILHNLAAMLDTIERMQGVR